MDIKCKDTGCERKEKCARHTAPDETPQEYFSVSPRWNGQECDRFFPAHGESEEDLRARRGEEAKELYKDLSN